MAEQLSVLQNRELELTENNEEQPVFEPNVPHRRSLTEHQRVSASSSSDGALLSPGPGPFSPLPRDKSQPPRQSLSSTSTSPQVPANSPSLAHSSGSISKASIRVHLPDAMVTSVAVQPGKTLREVLMKKMRFREISTEHCILEVISAGSRLRTVSWSKDSQELANMELIVKETATGKQQRQQQRQQQHQQVMHQFVKQSFSLRIAFCDKCRKLLFHAVRCQRCQAKFHKSCSESTPYCQTISLHHGSKE